MCARSDLWCVCPSTTGYFVASVKPWISNHHGASVLGSWLTTGQVTYYPFPMGSHWPATLSIYPEHTTPTPLSLLSVTCRAEPIDSPWDLPDCSPSWNYKPVLCIMHMLLRNGCGRLGNPVGDRAGNSCGFLVTDSAQNSMFGLPPKLQSGAVHYRCRFLMRLQQKSAANCDCSRANLWRSALNWV